MKKWIHRIGRKNLPLNSNTRVCSDHFVDAVGRLLRPDEIPLLRLPVLYTAVSKAKQRKPPRNHPFLEEASHDAADHSAIGEFALCDVGTQCEMSVGHELQEARARLEILEKQVKEQGLVLTQQKFRLSSMEGDDDKIDFYTGLPSYGALIALYKFLGPAVDTLRYTTKQPSGSSTVSKRCRPRSLPPIEEMFLTLVRLRLGLMEQDLAYRFSISQPTVSRIICTWINFLYLKLKEIPLWSPRELIQANMPQQFKDSYPTTRVIIDATEIFVEQPKLPELQQMTFSSYKNDNTYKGLVGISPGGVITFVSSLHPGSISDQELTRRSGIMDLLEPGDSVMADRGFDIEEDLVLRGVCLNIPPFLCGKKQLTEKELIITRRIASLRIHVEQAMERLKNFHIFNRTLPVAMTDIANRIFFVCCVLSNFQPPLCTPVFSQ